MLLSTSRRICSLARNSGERGAGWFGGVRMLKSRRGLLGGVIGLGLSAGLWRNRAAAQETVSYTYDGLGRVETVTYGGGVVITYTYDAAGNRTQVVQGAPPPPPPPPPLTATASESNWNWVQNDPDPPVVPPPVNVNVTGGVPGNGSRAMRRPRPLTGPGRQPDSCASTIPTSRRRRRPTGAAGSPTPPAPSHTPATSSSGSPTTADRQRHEPWPTVTYGEPGREAEPRRRGDRERGAVLTIRREPPQ